MYPNQPPPPPPQRQTVKRGANHGLHLVLSLLTCGVWAITGWPIAALMGRKETTTVQPQPGQWQPQPPPAGLPPAGWQQGHTPPPGWQAPPPGATPPPGYGYPPQGHNPYTGR